MTLFALSFANIGSGRLVVGQSLMLRRVVPILGVPDALVPLDLPVCQISLIPGYCPFYCCDSAYSVVI